MWKARRGHFLLSLCGKGDGGERGQVTWYPIAFTIRVRRDRIGRSQRENSERGRKGEEQRKKTQGTVRECAKRVKGKGGKMDVIEGGTEVGGRRNEYSEWEGRWEGRKELGERMNEYEKRREDRNR